MEQKPFSQIAIVSLLCGIVFPIVFTLASLGLFGVVGRFILPIFFMSPIIFLAGILLAWTAIVRINRYNQRGKWLAWISLLINLGFFIYIVGLMAANWGQPLMP